MAFDRKDYVVNKPDRAGQMMPLVRLVAGAAPVMNALTHDENWNRYLTYLQGMIERFTSSRDLAKAKLSDSVTWKHEELLKLKSDALVADAMIQAWQLAMDIPKAIMDGSQEAQRVIQEFEEKHEPAAAA